MSWWSCIALGVTLISKNSDPLVFLLSGLTDECIGVVIAWCVVVVVVV